MKKIGPLHTKGISMLFLCFLLWSLPALAETALSAPTPTEQKTAGIGDTARDLSSAGPAAKGEPADATEHTRKGNLLLKQGQFDAAIRSFDDALTLNPHHTAAKISKGIALSGKGELTKAELVLKDALLHNPDPVNTHYQLGLVYEKMGDWNKASNEYKEGIRKHEQGRR